MNHVHCAPASTLPSSLNPNIDYLSLYSNPGNASVGWISSGWPDYLSNIGFNPSIIVWDFVSLALSVAAADLNCIRSKSSDGWTRVIKLEIRLHDPAPWMPQKTALQDMLRFLTGDFWELTLLGGGEPPPQSTAPITYQADCVSLLSGGMDSLVGAIDLKSAGKSPLFVSQVAKGDRDTQLLFAHTLGATNRHLQWNHRIKLTHASERSTRGRSIVFFAYAVLAASVIPAPIGQPVDIYVPENGFISLNVPLTAGRFGSYSTKTTHPIFLERLQALWDAIGIPAKLVTPYEFMTKGEVLAQCSDQPLLRKLINQSTSCGRYGYYGYNHCGRCVPCMVRRASFIKAGIDDTRKYVFEDLSKTGREKGANDIGAAAIAYHRLNSSSASHLYGGALNFSDSSNRSQYEGVVDRGIREIGTLLQSHGVI